MQFFNFVEQDTLDLSSMFFEDGCTKQNKFTLTFKSADLEDLFLQHYFTDHRPVIILGTFMVLFQALFPVFESEYAKFPWVVAVVVPAIVTFISTLYFLKTLHNSSSSVASRLSRCFVHERCNLLILFSCGLASFTTANYAAEICVMRTTPQGPQAVENCHYHINPYAYFFYATTLICYNRLMYMIPLTIGAVLTCTLVEFIHDIGTGTVQSINQTLILVAMSLGVVYLSALLEGRSRAVIAQQIALQQRIHQLKTQQETTEGIILSTMPRSYLAILAKKQAHKQQSSTLDGSLANTYTVFEDAVVVVVSFPLWGSMDVLEIADCVGQLDVLTSVESATRIGLVGTSYHIVYSSRHRAADATQPSSAVQQHDTLSGLVSDGKLDKKLEAIGGSLNLAMSLANDIKQQFTNVAIGIGMEMGSRLHGTMLAAQYSVIGDAVGKAEMAAERASTHLLTLDPTPSTPDRDGETMFSVTDPCAGPELAEFVAVNMPDRFCLAHPNKTREALVDHDVMIAHEETVEEEDEEEEDQYFFLQVPEIEFNDDQLIMNDEAPQMEEDCLVQEQEASIPVLHRDDIKSPSQVFVHGERSAVDPPPSSSRPRAEVKRIGAMSLQRGVLQLLAHVQTIRNSNDSVRSVDDWLDTCFTSAPKPIAEANHDAMDSAKRSLQSSSHTLNGQLTCGPASGSLPTMAHNLGGSLSGNKHGGSASSHKAAVAFNVPGGGVQVASRNSNTNTPTLARLPRNYTNANAAIDPQEELVEFNTGSGSDPNDFSATGVGGSGSSTARLGEKRSATMPAQLPLPQTTTTNPLATEYQQWSATEFPDQATNSTATVVTSGNQIKKRNKPPLPTSPLNPSSTGEQPSSTSVSLVSPAGDSTVDAEEVVETKNSAKTPPPATHEDTISHVTDDLYFMRRVEARLEKLRTKSWFAVGPTYCSDRINQKFLDFGLQRTDRLRAVAFLILLCYLLTGLFALGIEDTFDDATRITVPLAALFALGPVLMSQFRPDYSGRLWGTPLAALCWCWLAFLAMWSSYLFRTKRNSSLLSSVSSQWIINALALTCVTLWTSRGVWLLNQLALALLYIYAYIMDGDWWFSTIGVMGLVQLSLKSIHTVIQSRMESEFEAEAKSTAAIRKLQKDSKRLEDVLDGLLPQWAVAVLSDQLRSGQSIQGAPLVRTSPVALMFLVFPLEPTTNMDNLTNGLSKHRQAQQRFEQFNAKVQDAVDVGRLQQQSVRVVEQTAVGALLVVEPDVVQRRETVVSWCCCEELFAILSRLATPSIADGLGRSNASQLQQPNVGVLIHHGEAHTGLLRNQRLAFSHFGNEVAALHSLRRRIQTSLIGSSSSREAAGEPLTSVMTAVPTNTSATSASENSTLPTSFSGLPGNSSASSAPLAPPTVNGTYTKMMARAWVSDAGVESLRCCHRHERATRQLVGIREGGGSKGTESLLPEPQEERCWNVCLHADQTFAATAATDIPARMEPPAAMMQFIPIHPPATAAGDTRDASETDTHPTASNHTVPLLGHPRLSFLAPNSSSNNGAQPTTTATNGSYGSNAGEERFSVVAEIGEKSNDI